MQKRIYLTCFEFGALEYAHYLFPEHNRMCIMCWLLGYQYCAVLAMSISYANEEGRMCQDVVHKMWLPPIIQFMSQDASFTKKTT